MKTALYVAVLVCALFQGSLGFMAKSPLPQISGSHGLRMAANTASGKIRIAILGASGYTGAELVRLLMSHPDAEITVLTGQSQAGQPFAKVFPQYQYTDALPDLTLHEDHTWEDVDCVFCCLPHATTQVIIKSLPEHLKIVDLSADFRLKDVNSYAEWYGGEHAAPELQKEAVYGLVEHARDDIKSARLIANPGCYPTAAQLPLIPLVKQKIIKTEDIIIDAKSGTTGAGRAPKQGTLFCEVSDGISAYAIGAHRHAPEIEQGLSEAAMEDVVVNFSPHLMPMNRGILETIYVKLENGKTVDDAKAALEAAYKDEKFVTVMPGAALPQTRFVRGSNYVFINVLPDRVPNRAIIVSAIDNLVKGASGQAIQNMNLLFGVPEHTGIDMAPMFP
ncbi:unnamed protein product [Chrysoparadoxa australica]